MITDYRLDEIQARPIYKLSGWVYKAGNTNYGVEASRDFQLTEDDFSANGNTIRVEGGGAYPIGNAVCKTCSLTLKESANYSANDFNGACIELMIKAYNSTGSWVVTGDYYFVQTAKKTGGQIVLECADFMSKANVPYKKGGYLAHTATLKNLFADVCSKCGVAADADNTFPNSDFTYTINAWQNFNSYTCRQMLGFIAMIAGGNALAIAGGTGFKINALNIADENSLYQWSRFTDDAESITVTGVEMTENTSLGWKPVEDPVTYKSSEYSGSYVLDLTEAENPLFKGRDQQAVDLIMTAVSGLTMRNFSGTHIGYPLAEYGDRAAITHRGGSLSTYITEYEWNISGATTFACNVNGAAANNETYSGAGGAIISDSEGSGGDTGAADGAVRYDITQSLSDTEKAKARANIGAGTSEFDGRYSSLAGRPTIPTKTSDLTNDSGFGTYSKPAGGIPESDLSFDVKTKLNARGPNIITIETENVDPLNPYKSSKTLTAIKNDFTHNIEQFVFYDNISYKLEKIITDNGVEKAVFYSTARLVNDVLTYYTCEIYEGNFGYSTAGFHTYTVNNVSAVESVNGRTGAVVLDADAVGAQRPLIPGSGISIVWREDGDVIQSDASGGGGTIYFVEEDGGVPIAQFTLNQMQDYEINVNTLTARLSTKVNNLEVSLSNNYRTAAAQDVIDNGKQDVIADLATIRNGAAKGATALQSVPAAYRTAAEQDVIDNTKLTDAPTDGKAYSRKNGSWQEVVGAVESVNGKTGRVNIYVEDIHYTNSSQKLDATIAGLKAADIQTASDISELQTADASLDSRITAIETGDTPVTLYIYWASVAQTGRVSLTKNGTDMSVADFISKMQSGAKIIIGENNDVDSESYGFSNYRYKITDSTAASLAFDVANSFNGSNRTIIISGSSSAGGLMTGYQDIGHDDLPDYSPLPEGSTPASKAWVEDYVDTKLADGIIIPSSTVGSTKRFKLTVDDSGAITATEVTT